MIVNPFTKQVLVVNHPGHPDQSVHAPGRATRVLHGTARAPFKKFKTQEGWVPGFAFTDSPKIAERYAQRDTDRAGAEKPRVLTVDLPSVPMVDMNNDDEVVAALEKIGARVPRYKGKLTIEDPGQLQHYAERLQEIGYQGLKMKKKLTGATEYQVFDPDLIDIVDQGNG